MGFRRRVFTSFTGLLLATIGMAAWVPVNAEVHKAHAITLYDEAPKYPAGFSHFDYVNPNAPKGGVFRIAPVQESSFDSFNPYIAKGNPVSTGSIETLMTSSEDEPFTEYGLIAESIEWPDDRSWVIFNLNPDARWHDGEPILADDVVWTFNTLFEKGRPVYRFYYSTVEKVEVLSERRVKFSFTESNNRELPLIIGQLPVLPKHYWESRDFSKTTLEPPLGSGPYRIKDFDAGRYVVQERVPEYWGKDLGVNKGLNNFQEMRTDFYRDVTAIRLALKAGKLDFRHENQAKAWALDYDIPAVDKGWLIKEQVEHQMPQGMQGLFLNSRRVIFSDPLVREAMSYAFDFEWTNHNLFFDQYTRTESYFSNSAMAATGLPENKELAILERFRGQIPERVFTEEFKAPTTDGSGWPRDNLLKAVALLEQAGWVVKDQVLTHSETGQPFEFEILLVSQAFERIMLPMVRNLTRLGMDVRIRLVDSTQFINRIRSFDFDTFIGSIGQSENPGNEQREYWTQAAAIQEGSRNYAGVSSPVIDAIVDELIQADDRDTLTATVKALDRVLLFGFYVVPNWHLAADRVLYWDKFSRPAVPLKSGVSTSRWWFDPAKTDRLQIARGQDQSLQGDSDAVSDVGSGISWWRLFLLAALLIVGVWSVRHYWGRKS